MDHYFLLAEPQVAEKEDSKPPTSNKVETFLKNQSDEKKNSLVAIGASHYHIIHDVAVFEKNIYGTQSKRFFTNRLYRCPNGGWAVFRRWELLVSRILSIWSKFTSKLSKIIPN